MLRSLLAYAPQMVRAEVSGRLWRALEAAEAASPVDAVAAVSRELGATLGATEVSFLIADLSGRALVRLSHVPTARAGDGEGDGDRDRAAAGRHLPDGERRAAGEQAEVIPFDGGPGEEAVRTQTVQVLAPGRAALGRSADDQWTVLAPMTQRGEVIGLLELRLPEEPDPDASDEIARLAHVLAFVVIASRRHTDLYEWGQRSRPHSLSAEIQQRLLPGQRTCEAEAESDQHGVVEKRASHHETSSVHSVPAPRYCRERKRARE